MKYRRCGYLIAKPCLIVNILPQHTSTPFLEKQTNNYDVINELPSQIITQEPEIKINFYPRGWVEVQINFINPTNLVLMTIMDDTEYVN